MSDLLKQAIADAKTVRATALANAKHALEEAFTPKLQSMLAAKLQQEVEAAEDEVPAPVTDEVPVADAPVSLEPSAETVPTQDVAPAAEVPVAPVAPDEEESMEEYKTLGSGHPDSVDQNQPSVTTNLKHASVGSLEETDKASTDYKKTTSGHKTDNFKPKTNVATTPSANKDGEDTPGGQSGLKTTSKTSGKASSDYKKTATGGSIDREVSSLKDIDPDGHTAEVNKPKSADKQGSDTPAGALEENDVNVDDESLDEILKELESEVNQSQGLSLEGEECVSDAGAVAPAAPVAPAAGDEEINLSELMEDDDKDADDKKSDADAKDDDKEARGNKAPWMKENAQLKTELQEYRNAVKFLRDRINEVNLLNAKLLYTNKLFKQAALTNEQKMKVIESFDLTKSVREAKLVYATLSESFNFGAKKSAPVVAAPKKAVATTVSTITEGLASKTIASTKPSKEILSEGTEMASRFKKLAGIRK